MPAPVITGLGIITAAGCGVDEVWDSIARGASGLKPLTLFQSPRYGQVFAGEIQRDLVAMGAPRRGSRSDRLGWLAARAAIQSARLDIGSCGERAGIVLGCSVGGSFDSERFLETLIKTGKMRAGSARYHECVSVVDLIANDFGLMGPSMALAVACSSGAQAIAMAAEMIQSGEADVMLAGGADSLSRMTWGGFHSLLLVDGEGCKPFDAGRSGMTLGEGAAVLVIESEDSARARGAEILARVSGWGGSCDAYHVTAPHPEGAGALAAMQSALKRAQIDPTQIQYVNAHGTGTRDNDLAESKALKKLFSDRVPPFSSTKRFFGHSLAASGAIEAVLCIEALRRQQMPPNPGFASVDPAIGLAPVTALQSAPLTHVMSNSFGFGGNNAVLVFSKADVAVRPQEATRGPIAIAGLGVIGPGTPSVREIEAPLPPGKASVIDCGEIARDGALTPAQRRRMSRLAQMALAAVRRAHTPDATKTLSVSIGTGMGFMGAAGAFIENYIAKSEREPMPTQFSTSVHNAAASQIAMELQARGFNSAPTVGEVSFESALWLAITQLAAHEADQALAGSVDELNKYILSIGQRWGMWTEETRPGEGAVVASLARAENVSAPLARVTALRLGRYRRPFDAAREARWIASVVDLKSVDLFISGAGGTPQLDPYYEAVAAALPLEHKTYKQTCGEFHSASAFGFAQAVEAIRQGARGALVYTLSQRGAKALCCLQP